MAIYGRCYSDEWSLVIEDRHICGWYSWLAELMSISVEFSIPKILQNAWVIFTSHQYARCNSNIIYIYVQQDTVES